MSRAKLPYKLQSYTISTHFTPQRTAPLLLKPIIRRSGILVSMLEPSLEVISQLWRSRSSMLDAQGSSTGRAHLLKLSLKCFAMIPAGQRASRQRAEGLVLLLVVPVSLQTGSNNCLQRQILLPTHHEIDAHPPFQRKLKVKVKSPNEIVFFEDYLFSNEDYQIPNSATTALTIWSQFI